MRREVITDTGLDHTKMRTLTVVRRGIRQSRTGGSPELVIDANLLNRHDKIERRDDRASFSGCRAGHPL
jgi:hypothetical protein